MATLQRYQRSPEVKLGSKIYLRDPRLGISVDFSAVDMKPSEHGAVMAIFRTFVEAMTNFHRAAAVGILKGQNDETISGWHKQPKFGLG